MCFVRIRMNNNTPMYTFGDIARTRGRIFPKLSYIFKILSFSHFFIKSNQKHDVAHPPLMFYPYVKFKNFPMSTFGDIAWTRGRTDRRTDGRTDRRTDGQTEKLKPISPRFTGDNNSYNLSH